MIPSQDQSAAFKISDMEIPGHTADEHDAPLIEWGLNTFLSVLASSKHVRSQ